MYCNDADSIYASPTNAKGKERGGEGGSKETRGGYLIGRVLVQSLATLEYHLRTYTSSE
jgi:hypothetical protein